MKLILVLIASLLVAGCGSKPIKIGCKEIGKASDGRELFKDCDDI